jgi:hypothetical protein
MFAPLVQTLQDLDVEATVSLEHDAAGVGVLPDGNCLHGVLLPAMVQLRNR